MTTTGRVHRLEIQVRFGDTDAMGHLNNTSFAFYAESGRLAFVGTMGEEVRALILAHLAIDFRRQVRFGESVVVETQVERLGTSSITLQQRILADGTLAADVRSVVVYFDYADAKARPIPDRLRALLARYPRRRTVGRRHRQSAGEIRPRRCTDQQRRRVQPRRELLGHRRGAGEVHF